MPRSGVECVDGHNESGCDAIDPYVHFQHPEAPGCLFLLSRGTEIGMIRAIGSDCCARTLITMVRLVEEVP
jgi:hypothetical protein